MKIKTIMAAALAGAALSVSSNMSANDLMTPETLWNMNRLGSFDVSPQGTNIVYTISTPDIQANKIRTAICLIKTDGTGRIQLTQDKESQVEPAFVDNGERIAYLQGGNLWTMKCDGSDKKHLSQGGDIEGYKFSPDGKLVVIIRQVESTTSIMAKEKDLPLATGLVINDMNYRHWDQYVQTIPHIFLASVDEHGLGEMKDLLEGEPYECPVLPFGGSEQFCWSPDGTQIAYTSRKKTGVDYVTSTDTDIYIYNVKTGLTTNVCKPEGYVEPQADALRSLEKQSKNQTEEDINAGYDQDPIFSPDGKWLAWKSMERDGYESDRMRLCILDLTTGKKRYVTEQFESGVDAFSWAEDSKTLYFTGVWQARTMVYQTNLKGDVEVLTTGDYDYGTVIPVPGSKQLLANRHSISAPDDLYLLTPVKRKGTIIKQVTFENREILSSLTMGEVKERWVNTTDGKKELCWVIYPPHFDKNKKYPTLLFCEGGPQSPVSQFWSYRWNFQIMAANGYIIIAPNRHGLPGFGMEWLEQISGDYSGQCMQDYLSAIDDICQESYVDKDRLGCVGASFGGYSVYWLAGHHDKRFKAFIAHDGIFNTTQQYYETEEMWFPNWDLGGTPDRNPNAKAFAESPHLYVDKWDTPILCIHGEKDYRILHSQGQSAFSAARMHGIPAQLLLYPDENHWVLKPQNGILWQRTYFRWLDRWLKADAQK
ncbi:MAG: S9 family peptidase [Bacteroidaceae bacterium]